MHKGTISKQHSIALDAVNVVLNDGSLHPLERIKLAATIARSCDPPQVIGMGDLPAELHCWARLYAAEVPPGSPLDNLANPQSEHTFDEVGRPFTITVDEWRGTKRTSRHHNHHGGAVVESSVEALPEFETKAPVPPHPAGSDDPEAAARLGREQQARLAHLTSFGRYPA